jgi:hypothetical protein
MNTMLAPSVLGPLTESGSSPSGIPLPSDRSQNLRERKFVAVGAAHDCLQNREESIAHFTETVYQSVLRLGYRGSFLELELSLWKVIRQAVEQRAIEFISKDVA